MKKEKTAGRLIKISTGYPKIACTAMKHHIEVQRAKELYPIYKKFSFGLDIHSTTATASPFIIDVNGALEHCLCSGFPSEMNTVITNITAIQEGILVCYLFGDGAENVPSLVVETGKHNDNGPSFQRAIDCALAFCINCGVLQPGAKKATKKFEVFKVIKSVCFKGRTYAIEAFAEITTGTPLGKSAEGIEIFSPVSGFNLFGTKEEDKDESEEAFFILKKLVPVEC